MKRWVLISLLACGCQEEQDYCADLELPECPEACPDDYAASCGEPCTEDDPPCGNTIGDGRECVDEMWVCSVHAPLEPDTCNRICN